MKQKSFKCYINSKRATITFSDDKIIIEVNDERVEVCPCKSLELMLHGDQFVSGGHFINLKIMPHNLNIKNMDATLVKCFLQYFLRNDIDIQVHGTIRERVHHIWKGVDSEGKLDELYKFNIKNFFCWIRRTSSIYNYSHLIGDSKSGKHKENAPRWVFFLSVFLFSILFTGIFFNVNFIQGD